MITTNWSAAAAGQLAAAAYTQTGQVAARNAVNNWILDNAGGWLLNAVHNHTQDPARPTNFTVTASVTAIVGADRTVTISNFVP